MNGLNKKQRKSNTCPVCGTEVKEPEKTWNLISPFPDENGRLTLTVMGSYKCPKCGAKWKGVVSKIKVGNSGVEIETGKVSKKVVASESDNRKEVIELELDDILNED